MFLFHAITVYMLYTYVLQMVPTFLSTVRLCKKANYVGIISLWITVSSWLLQLLFSTCQPVAIQMCFLIFALAAFIVIKSRHIGLWHLTVQIVHACWWDNSLLVVLSSGHWLI